ncbi:MAG: hypothetical protein IT305_13315 [Chloroflexi bacterium]|nr:hypothetical protein [Chloroflexota bacterium]
MADDRAEAWLRLKRAAAERLDEQVQQALVGAATRAWGRGRFRRPHWQVVRAPDDASWRAYNYLGSAEGEHRYLELGVIAHLDPEGNLVGYGVDDGVHFIGLHDTSDYGLQRGLDHIRQQRRQVRAHAQPVYDHPIRPYPEET